MIYFLFVDLNNQRGKNKVGFGGLKKYQFDSKKKIKFVRIDQSV